MSTNIHFNIATNQLVRIFALIKLKKRERYKNNWSRTIYLRNFVGVKYWSLHGVSMFDAIWNIDVEHRHNAVFYTLVVDASDVTLQNTTSWQILLVLAHVHRFRSGLRNNRSTTVSLFYPLHLYIFRTYITPFIFFLQ